MGKRWCTVIWRSSAVVLAVSVAAPAASGFPAVAKTSPAPAPLVGTWKRTLTSADLKRVGATLVHPGICTLTIKKDSVLNASVVCTGGQKGGQQGIVDAAGANRVHIKLIEPVPDVYSWKVSGRLLTLTKVKDTVADREAVFWGVWRRT